MKRIIFAILAVLISTSAFADAGDRGGRNDRRNDQRSDGRHDGRYDHGRPGQHHPPHNGGGYNYPRPRPPVFLPPVYVPPVYQQPYYPQVQVVHCGSIGYRPNLCYTGMRIVRRIDILRQYSHSSCIPGQTALLQGNSILVTNGCEADFRIEGNY